METKTKPQENEAKRRCADLVDAYYMIQETRKRLDLREQAMCRDEIILLDEKKAVGRILGEENGTVTIQGVTGQERDIEKAKVRRILRARFDDVEKAKEAIYRWPVGKRIADVSSDIFLQMEKDLKREMEGIVREWPVWSKWLVNIKGIGPITAAGIWAHVDIRIAETVSKLWHFAGHHLDAEGRVPTLKKGVRRSWNRRLQTIVWNGGESIVRSTGGYRALYEQFKAEEVADRFFVARPDQNEMAGAILAEDIGKHKMGKRVANASSARSIIAAMDPPRPVKMERTPGHIDRRARRKMRKVFLGHLWIVWRTEEGLPVTPVYIMGREGHNREIPIPAE